MKISVVVVVLMSLILSSALLDDIVNAQAGPPQTPSGATFPGPPQPPSGPGYPQPPPTGPPQPPSGTRSPGAPQPPSAYCSKNCGQRCAMKGPGSRCEKYCLMCCAKCNCVPAGTYGNLDQCPCYRDWKSPNGRPKCP
uniref:Gibberellin regulated protein n=1 Tax=Opuntia streptacantha TaxID=393608 RepID=A0A7C9DDU2_OPUST